MNTSFMYHAFGVHGYECTNSYKGKQIIYNLQKQKQRVRCGCGSYHVVRNGFKCRDFTTIPIGRKQNILHVKIQRYVCRHCGNSFYENVHFASGKHHYTHQLARYVIGLLRFTTIKNVAHMTGLHWDTVKEIHKKYLFRKFSPINIDNVKHIGIDEFAIRKGHKYMTIVVDMDTGAIIYAAEGKGSDSLNKFWKKVQKRGINIESVSTDLSAAYISSIYNNAPHAKKIFDHFHVQKLMNAALDDIRRVTYNMETDYNKRKIIKGSRWLLLHNQEDILDDETKSNRLKNVLNMNEPLQKAYVLKEYLREIWMQPNKDEAERVLEDWAKQAYQSNIKQLIKVANTIKGFRSGILAYYDHRTSNAKVEGINNKIKVLKRNAYGFRDMDYFMLRLFNLHNETITRFVG